MQLKLKLTFIASIEFKYNNMFMNKINIMLDFFSFIMLDLSIYLCIYASHKTNMYVYTCIKIYLNIFKI